MNSLEDNDYNAPVGVGEGTVDPDLKRWLDHYVDNWEKVIENTRPRNDLAFPRELWPNLIEIRSDSEWHRMKADFIKDCEEGGFISFDTESNVKDQGKGYHVYGVIGNTKGTVLVLWFTELYPNTKPVLFPELIDLFTGGSVIVCGSAICKDIKEYANVPENRLLDTQVLYDYGLSNGFFTWDPSSSGVARGLGCQAVEVYETVDAYLKPKDGKRKKEFFKPEYDVPVDWNTGSVFRKPWVMYHWGRAGTRLHNRQKGYLFVDGLTPVLLVCKALCFHIKSSPGRFSACQGPLDMFLFEFPDLLGRDHVPASAGKVPCSNYYVSTSAQDDLDVGIQPLVVDEEEGLNIHVDETLAQSLEIVDNVHVGSSAMPELNTTEQSAEREGARKVHEVTKIIKLIMCYILTRLRF